MVGIFFSTKINCIKSMKIKLSERERKEERNEGRNEGKKSKERKKRVGGKERRKKNRCFNILLHECQ